jgi:hypothetical protein
MYSDRAGRRFSDTFFESRMPRHSGSSAGGASGITTAAAATGPYKQTSMASHVILYLQHM